MDATDRLRQIHEILVAIKTGIDGDDEILDLWINYPQNEPVRRLGIELDRSIAICELSNPTKCL